MGWFFNVIFMLYGLVALPFFISKGKHKEGWRERWGYVPAEVAYRLRGKPVFWVHAVSVGEVRLASHFISQIRRRIPGMQVLLTTTTASGRATARKLLAPEDEILYLPFDFTFAGRRFLNTLKPKIAVFLETEIWPNLLCELQRRSIPAMIINGRISVGAFHKYRWARWVIKGCLNRLAFCLVQSKEHRDRFLKLGIDPARVRIIGNMKFDVALEAKDQKEDFSRMLGKFKVQHDSFLFFCASTHAGEEEMILEACARLKGLCPRLRLVLAPRHLERLPSLEALFRKRNLSFVRFSELASASEESMSEVCVVDQWGILNQIYPHADVVFIGGSLVPWGGHNIAEAAFFGKPILHGPHMQNFSDMAEEFRRNRASVTVRDERELETAVSELFKHHEKRSAAARQAKEVVLNNQGATRKYVEEVLQCLQKRGLTDFAVVR